jgi:serine/threonine-protein kinase
VSEDGGNEPGEPEILLGTPFNEAQPIFSPDGHWLAYTSDESGRAEVYVRPFPGPGGKVQISTEGGGHPLWAGNGRELFYRSGDKVMSVSLTLEPEPRPARPVQLFEGRYAEAPLFIVQELLYYDVARDGQHFVMIKPVESESEPTELHVVLNWFEELKARVPTE